MDQETLGQAFVKLAAVNDKVGHPIDSEWPNYSGLIIYPGLFLFSPSLLHPHSFINPLSLSLFSLPTNRKLLQ